MLQMNTTCILSLWGMTSKERYLKMLKAFPPTVRDRARLKDEEPQAVHSFENTFRQGDLDPSWYGAMRDAGLSFTWEARVTDEFGNSTGGIMLYHAPSQTDFSYSLDDQEISILLAELKVRPKEAIEEAKLCEVYWSEGAKVGLHIASSRHEEMEKLARSPELRAYLAPSVPTPSFEN